MQNHSRLYILISSFLGLLILLTIVYLIGLARGRGETSAAIATAQAQAMLQQMVATDTATATPTHTETPTITPTPSETPTPTASPTPSPTPASPEEWAQRFLDQSANGLNLIAGLEFTPERAEALLRASAQQQFLIFAPVSYVTLNASPWSALVTPRTPDGKALPMLFWQEPNDQNRVRAQLLLDLFDTAEGRDYQALRPGLQQGAMRGDPQGRFHALLVERPGAAPILPAYLLAQPSPAADFALVWSSLNEPLWSVEAQQSSVTLDPQSSFLPDMVVDGLLPAGSALRPEVRAPGTFVEQAPFARQWANSRWTPAILGDLSSSGAITGYRLQGAGLRSTPLTSLAQIISLLQSGGVDQALTYATRLDLVQQAFDLGLGQPGWWMAIYLDDAGREVFDRGITARLRFFDNGKRERTFDASFELDGSGFYKLSAIQLAPSFANAVVTAAAPLPTFTPTSVSLGTPSPTPLIATPTASATPLPAGAPTSTPTATLTPTPGPSPTFTVTPTPSVTATPTETPTAPPTNTATPTPLPIPAIPPDQSALVTGVTNVSEPARLRGGPGFDYPVIVPVDNALDVGLFGITVAGDWYLIRIDEPGHPNRGQLGWMFRDLVFVQEDLTLLPQFAADGTSLTPEPILPTATAGPPTETTTPEPPPTATPLQTPQVRLPQVDAPGSAGVPPPEAGEIMVTLAGDSLPANPLAPIPATTADGREFFLAVEDAQIQIWGGVLGQSRSGWVPAPGEFLWPGSTVYVRLEAPLPESAAEGEEGASGAPPVPARSVRIVGAPVLERIALEDGAAYAQASASQSSVALVGGEAAGVNLLDTSGSVTPLWPDGNSATWLDDSGLAGLVVTLASAPHGRDGFVWVREDGAGLRFWAQPWFRISGVAGDAYTGLWWVERPAAGDDGWQIWNWDPASGLALLRFSAGSDLFSSASPLVSDNLAPRLLAVRAATPGDNTAVSLFMETEDTLTQQINRGLFRLNLRTGPVDRGSLDGAPRLLIAPGAYANPLAISPDQSRLAYAVHDSDQPSLTAGQVKPANRIKLLTLEGRGSGTIRTVYQTETALEFIAPLLAWQDSTTLLTARSRFAADTSAGLDLFGAVWIDLPLESPGASALSARIPAQKRMLDLAGCRRDQSALLVLLNNDGSLEHDRWNVIEPLTPRYTVPNNLTRALLCWRTPQP